MATITVAGKLTNPAAVLPARGAVTLQLVDYDDSPVIGFDTTDQTEIVSAYTVMPGADGTWTQALVPNASIQGPNGAIPTAWRVVESGGGTSETYWIVVPPTGGPYWVGTLRTTLTGTVQPAPYANVSIAGALTVGGTFTLDGTAIGAPPNDGLKFLSGTGAWAVPGGGPPSGTAGGDLAGSYPNPTLGDTAHLHTLIDARIPAALPPSGGASGDLAGTYPAPTVAKVNGVTVGGTPAAGKVLAATSSTAAAWTTPASTRDAYTAKLGLITQPFPVETVDDVGLGLTAGFLIMMLVRPGAATINNLGLWLGTAGSGASGVSSMALFDETGVRLAVTGDMTSALTSGANAGTYVEAAVGTPYTTADATNYYIGVLCQMSSNPTIAGAFAGGVLHIPAMKGHRDAITFGSQSSMPSSVTIASGNTAGAAYWLVAS